MTAESTEDNMAMFLGKWEQLERTNVEELTRVFGMYSVPYLYLLYFTVYNTNGVMIKHYVELLLGKQNSMSICCYNFHQFLKIPLKDNNRDNKLKLRNRDSYCLQIDRNFAFCYKRNCTLY